MKVVLRHHVDNLGDRGDIVNVATGYARNFLIPKGMAMTATPGNLKSLELRRKSWAVREARELDAAKAFAGQLSAVELTIAKKAGEHETLYGSVTNSELAENLAAKGFDIDRRRILLEEPIKTLGTFPVSVKVHPQVSAQISVHVVPEREPA